MQSKKSAWMEQFIRVGIGFITNYPINCFILASFGLSKPNTSMAKVSLYITLVFTVWALIRGYMVRRLFDWLEYRKANKKSPVLTNKDEIMNFNQDGFALD
jgi:hypothetical protein